MPACAVPQALYLLGVLLAVLLGKLLEVLLRSLLRVRLRVLPLPRVRFRVHLRDASVREPRARHKHPRRRCLRCERVESPVRGRRRARGRRRRRRRSRGLHYLAPATPRPWFGELAQLAPSLCCCCQGKSESLEIAFCG